MTEDQIPPQVRAFIADRVDSVVQLEVLLLLQANPQSAYTPADIVRELRINADWAQDQLDTLAVRGLLAKGPADGGYRYGPNAPDLDAAVRGLAAAYADFRVTVTTLIFTKPDKPTDPIKSFADAFRIRRDDRNG